MLARGFLSTASPVGQSWWLQPGAVSHHYSVSSASWQPHSICASRQPASNNIYQIFLILLIFRYWGEERMWNIIYIIKSWSAEHCCWYFYNSINNYPTDLWPADCRSELQNRKQKLFKILQKLLAEGVQLNKNVGTELSNFRERMTWDNETIFNIIRWSMRWQSWRKNWLTGPRLTAPVFAILQAGSSSTGSFGTNLSDGLRL